MTATTSDAMEEDSSPASNIMEEEEEEDPEPTSNMMEEEEGDDPAPTSNTMEKEPAPSSDPAGCAAPPVSAIQLLPEDALHNVLLRLTLREAVASRAVSRFFHDALSSPPFLSLLPSLRLLLLRHPRPPSPSSSAASSAAASLHAFDPSRRRWLRIPLSFLPFPSFSPVASSPSLLYLWVDPLHGCGGGGGGGAAAHPPKSFVACNPLARSYRVLPPLGSAWSRHGTVLAGPRGAAIVLTELAALTYAPGRADRWLKYPLTLPSKPRSPILAADSIFALCDVGTPWRSQWKLFFCPLSALGGVGIGVGGGVGVGVGVGVGGGGGSGSGRWAPLERHVWGDVFEILKRPRLLPGAGGRSVLMIGGLRASFAVDAPCSTVLILRLDLATMEWDEAGRMPPEMYRCFTGAGEAGIGATMVVAAGNNKVKVFGGDGRVWFSGKRVRGKLAMWEEGEVEEAREAGKVGSGLWSWVEGVPGYSEGVYRGFVFDAGFTAVP